MDKQQKLKIALAVLAVVMIFVWMPILTGSSSKGKAGRGTEDDEAGQSSSNSNQELAALLNAGSKSKARSLYAEWGRNPFVLEEKPEKTVLSLEGILWDDVSPKAMISGNIVGVGESVNNAEIIDIRPTSVTIKDEMGERTLRMGE